MRKVAGLGRQCKHINSDIEMTNDTRESVIQVSNMREVRHKDQFMDRTQACLSAFHQLKHLLNLTGNPILNHYT